MKSIMFPAVKLLQNVKNHIRRLSFLSYRWFERCAVPLFWGKILTCWDEHYKVNVTFHEKYYVPCCKTCTKSFDPQRVLAFRISTDLGGAPIVKGKYWVKWWAREVTGTFKKIIMFPAVKLLHNVENHIRRLSFKLQMIWKVRYSTFLG